MNEGKQTGPKPQWWSRPDVDASGADSTAPSSAAESGAPAGAGPGHAGGGPGRADVVRPLHREDPYRTPPYGGPGPWAPAPPVELPPATPPHGVHVPPYTPPPAAAHTAPPQPVPRYDPWAAPLAPAPAQAAAHGPRTASTTRAPGRARRRRRTTFAVGALLIALVAGLGGGMVGAYAERSGRFSTVQLPQAPVEQSNSSGRGDGTVAEVAQAVLPGVVTVHVSGAGGQGTGTGFVLDERGHILTNHHVVEPAADGGKVQVTFHSGQRAVAELVGGDAGYDLAVLRVDGVSGLHPLPLGNSDSVRVGDPVIAVGAPYDLEGTVTTGIISAKERPVTAGGEAAGSDVSYVNALQTDASINPGNSGGPLVDAQGRVIGINSAIRSADENPYGLPGESAGGSIGLGFAIPVNQARRVAEELINTGDATHPVIGVTLDLAYEGRGARVVSGDGAAQAVVPGGPADEAGIRGGDVITGVDGERVDDGEELIVRIRSHRPGDRLSLTVERDGEQRTVRLTLGSSGGD